MFRYPSPYAIAIVALLATMPLLGCENAKEAVGLSKQGPDEFTVYRRAPLTLPPDYALRPPQPGAPRPGVDQPEDMARKALTGGTPIPQGDLSNGEMALLRSAGATEVDPSIRQTIDRETSILAEESASFTDRLIFWDTPAPFGTVVDPVKESQRIKENQALGESLTTGETPTIKRRRRALFEGIVN